MQVRKLDTARRRDVRQFVGFPFELYRNYPLWVPPLIADMELALNRSRHPFYRHSSADFFVAESEGCTLGRIAVMENRLYNQHQNRQTAFFYYLEMAEDREVARALFHAAFEWAHARGLRQVIGPKGLLSGDGLGLLVEGFEHRPAIGIAYNPPYYDALVRDSGFVPYDDLLSGYLSGSYDLPAHYYELAEKIKARRGFWVKSFTHKRELRQWFGRIGKVVNDAFVDTKDYYPVPDAELDYVGEQLLMVADPRLAKLVMKGQDIVGFVFAFPDISAALQRVRGRLWPLGWYHLLHEFKHTEWVNFNGLGLLPKHRGVGANVLLYTELAKTIHEYGFRHADIVQVGDENLKSRSDMEAMGVQWYKRHRIYTSTDGLEQA